MPSAYHHTVLGLAWLVPVTADFDMTDCLMVPLTLEDLREPLGVALGDLSSASFSLSWRRRRSWRKEDGRRHVRSSASALYLVLIGTTRWQLTQM